MARLLCAYVCVRVFVGGRGVAGGLGGGCDEGVQSMAVRLACE